MKVKLAAVMALAAAILVLAAYLFGMSWGPAPQSNQAGTLQEQVRALTEENTRLQLEIQRLESDKQDLELQLERLRTEHENRRQENQGLQDDLNRFREEAVQMDAEIERLRLENQRLRDRLLEDRDSPTGPLWFLVAVLTVLARSSHGPGIESASASYRHPPCACTDHWILLRTRSPRQILPIPACRSTDAQSADTRRQPAAV